MPPTPFPASQWHDYFMTVGAAPQTPRAGFRRDGAHLDESSPTGTGIAARTRPAA
jgi:hypothetical protein